MFNLSYKPYKYIYLYNLIKKYAKMYQNQKININLEEIKWHTIMKKVMKK
jgi:hypothetical protein